MQGQKTNLLDLFFQHFCEKKSFEFPSAVLDTNNIL